jgi:hypothetical protein
MLAAYLVGRHDDLGILNSPANRDLEVNIAIKIAKQPLIDETPPTGRSPETLATDRVAGVSDALSGVEALDTR